MCFYFLLKCISCAKNLINKLPICIKNTMNKKNTPPLNVNTLQIQGCGYNDNNIKSGSNKSTFLSTSIIKDKWIPGSMTLEASMVLPVFIYAILVFVNFFIMLNYQNIMQNNVNNAAKAVGRYMYLEDRAGELIDNKKKFETIKYDKDILINGINTGYVWNKILTDEVKKYTENINVVRGILGICIGESDINNNQDGINDIKVYYKIEVWRLGKSRGRLRMANRCYFRSWIGESICENAAEGLQKVYITKSGKVYHLYRDCTHIELSVHNVKFGELNELRNSYGGIYKKCERCVKKLPSENYIVYITDNGDSYHCNEKCSSIVRDVIEISINSVGNREICNRCKKKSEVK